MSQIDGQRLRRQREALGLTQTQLQDASGILQSTISKLEDGRLRGRSRDQQEALAAALRVPVEWLCGVGAPDLPNVAPGTDGLGKAFVPARMGQSVTRRAEIDDALMAALDKRRHTFADVAAVGDILFRTWEGSAEKLTAAGERLLDAAAEARREGQQVTPEQLATILAVQLASTTGDTHVERNERYPNRALAIAMEYERGASAKAIDLLRKVALEGDDPSPEWWRKKLREFQKQVQDARDDLRVKAGGSGPHKPKHTR